MEVIALKARVQDNAVLIGIVSREGIAIAPLPSPRRRDATAIDTQFVSLLDGGAQHGVLPVGTASQCGNLSVSVATLVAKIVLLVLSPFRGGEQVELLGHIAHAQRVVVVHVSLALAQLAFLRGDEDHAVGASRTVDSGGRHILQHLDAFNIIGIDGGQRVQAALNGTDARAVGGGVLEVDETIHHVEWLVGSVHRVTTTNTDVTVGTWLSAAGSHSQTSHLAA